MSETNIINCLQLEKHLKKELGEDINLTLYDPQSREIMGEYKDKVIHMAFIPNKYFCFISSENDIKQLRELILSISRAMKGIPICSYNIRHKKAKFFSMEWDFINPEQRISDVINNESSRNWVNENIALYNGKEIEDYIDEENKQNNDNKTSFTRLKGKKKEKK